MMRQAMIPALLAAPFLTSPARAQFAGNITRKPSALRVAITPSGKAMTGATTAPRFDL